MNDNLRTLRRTGLLLCLVFVAAVVALVFYPKLGQIRGLARRRDELQGKVDAKQREIQDIRRRQYRFTTDPDFVEHIARLNRRVRPDELVFIFDSDR